MGATPSTVWPDCWSSRLLVGEGTPISDATVARIWHRFGVQPWRAQTFAFSADRARGRYWLGGQPAAQPGQPLTGKQAVPRPQLRKRHLH